MIPSFPTLPPLALYVHIPWCIKKCPYCDFNSHVTVDGLPESEYIQALLLDLDSEVMKIANRPVISIFIGGGTPSLFSAESIDALLTGIKKRVSLSPMAEITLEANPGAIEAAKFAEFKAIGINRLSIGAQSFHSKQLTALGRIHGGDDIHAALTAAKLAGFDNINIDLMYGLPQQKFDEAIEDLKITLSLQPTHVSHYQLTLEPNTAFYSRPPSLPADDRIWDMQTRCQSLLFEAGYHQYEVSAYAAKGKHCQHNMNYWQFGDYLGIGAGAHQKLTHHKRISRSAKKRLPVDYMQGVHKQQHISDDYSIPVEDIPFEFMLNALRLNAGFSLDLFIERTGLPFSVIEQAVNHVTDKELLELNDRQLSTTSMGAQYLNDILMMFMPANAPELTQ